jgi:hypothetical protein
MIDRSPPYVVTATRIGRTDLGPGTAVVDDDAIFVVHTGAEQRPVRVPLSRIDSITVDDGTLLLFLHDGAQLALVMDAATQLSDELGLRCRTIPEMTHALRALGSRRGHHGRQGGRAAAADEQRRFFGPLLEARRRALALTSLNAVAAFEPSLLAQAISAALGSFAAGRYASDPPARRALEAELVDLCEPLLDVLSGLSAAADEVRTAPEDLRRWRRWAAGLRSTFETADRVWLSLDAALDAAPFES